MSNQNFVNFVILKIDKSWRKLPEEEKQKGRGGFITIIKLHKEIRAYVYSIIGLKRSADILLWLIGPSPDILQELISNILRTGLGKHMEVRHSMLGLIRESHYVHKQDSQEQSVFSDNRSHYLVIYPFTKTSDWYLLSQQVRQGMMNEHIRIGKKFPTVRQVLAYSFGLDDQEFIVSYETDKLEDFQDLVKALRETEVRRFTLKDTPVYLGVFRAVEEVLELLG